MITKINAVSFKANNRKNNSVANNSQTFGANYEPYKIKATELRIENLLSLRDDLFIQDIDLDAAARKTVFPSGEKALLIRKDNLGSSTEFKISSFDASGESKEIALINVKNNSYLPVLTYKQGKFKPEITVKHPELKGSRVKMLAGSELKTKDFSIKMPGSWSDKTNYLNKISFNGTIGISTCQLEEKTKNAVELYMKSKLYEKITPGAYSEDTKKYEPNFIIPAGGVGSRFYNITRDNENKPSATMPTDKGYRVMGTTLNMLATTGMLNKNSIKNIKYISEKGDLKGANVINSKRFSNDGGSIADALAQKAIDNSKDTIILNADIFTNADITRVYHALKTLPQAALVIPYYPVNSERAKSFGLLGTEKDEQGNLLLKSFIEKPKDTNALEVQPARLSPEEFAANPGMYVLSKEATEILKNMKLLYGDDKLGLGHDVMPKIVELCNAGLLRNDKGEVMKAYTVPLQRPDGEAAFWDDIGSAEAFLKVVKDVARETEKKGTGVKNKFYGVPEFVLKDFTKNTDLNSGVVFQSDFARSNFQNFANKIGLSSILGNIYVVD